MVMICKYSLESDVLTCVRQNVNLGNLIKIYSHEIGVGKCCKVEDSYS